MEETENGLSYVSRHRQYSQPYFRTVWLTVFNASPFFKSSKPWGCRAVQGCEDADSVGKEGKYLVGC